VFRSEDAEVTLLLLANPLHRRRRPVSAGVLWGGPHNGARRPMRI